jgi:hypothetical protein|tara:strand:- start:5136 stop:5843 length:708 start_codon:yes stop_codon:yes gene_type:complete
MVMSFQMKMTAVLSGLLFTVAPIAVDANEDKLTKGYYTFDAMGCMLLRECTEGVKEVHSLLDISSQYEEPEKFTHVSREFNNMLTSLHTVGVKVFLADEKYFPVGHRGVYHTVSNNFYLNRRFMHRPHVLMSVMRHEGWHAAQDCMAGTIDNSLIAIIMDEEKVPMIWQEIASDTYKSMPHAIPWEKEATWAGKTEGMTEAALASCARGKMWYDYKPTPLTRQWLEENGYDVPRD